MNKQQALEKLNALEREVAELRAIIEKSDVKPLFPESFEEGAHFVVNSGGCIESLCEDNHIPEWVEDFSEQGRTFYTREAAEAFIKRERARAYCLERINEVNEGDNGFNEGEANFHLKMNRRELYLTWSDTYILQTLPSSEYVRTEEGAEQLINDLDFVEQWKIWKGVK